MTTDVPANHLDQFVQSGSADAFRGVVEAHVDAVYSQSLRQLRDPEAAEEVTQIVFATLAQKAAKIGPRVILSGWLFKATRYCCSNYQRSAARRRSAERKAALMRNEATSSQSVTEENSATAEKLVDDALSRLGERDRDALLLRYFQGRSLREVGDAMGISEDAAKQRVFRAVEKLRQDFSSRGVTLETAGIASLLTAAVRPAGQRIVESALKAAPAKGAVGAGILGHTAWTWPKIAAGFVAAGALATAITFAAHSAMVQTPIKSAGNPSPAQPGPIVQLASNAPSVAAATSPSLTQDTPVNALIKFLSGISQNDSTAIEQCLVSDPTLPRPMLSADNVQTLRAALHLEDVWQKKYGKPMSDYGYTPTDLPPFAISSGLALLRAGGAGSAKVDGDLAYVTLPLAPELFMTPEPNRMTFIERWGGAQLVLRSVNGQWKMDMDRTLIPLITLNRRPGNNEDPVVVCNKVGHDMAEAYDTFAQQVADGDYATPEEAKSAGVQQFETVDKTNGIDGISWGTLPAIGGPRIGKAGQNGIAAQILSQFAGAFSPRPAAAATTSPSTVPVGQETPINALSKLCTALELDDRPSIDECVCDDGVDGGQAKLGRTWLYGEAGDIRLQKDWANKFGQSVAVSGYSFEMPYGPFNGTLRGILEDTKPPTVIINGDEAQVKIPLPSTYYACGTGAERNASTERWAGAMLVMKQSGGAWRLDTDRTFNFVYTMQRSTNNTDSSLAIEADLQEGIADSFDDVATMIENGKITNVKAAAAALGSAVRDSFATVHLNSSGIFTLPVIGGPPDQ